MNIENSRNSTHAYVHKTDNENTRISKTYSERKNWRVRDVLVHDNIDHKKKQYETLYKTGELAKNKEMIMGEIKKYEEKLKTIQAEKVKIESPYRSLTSGNVQKDENLIFNSLKDNNNYQNILRQEKRIKQQLVYANTYLKNVQILLKEFSNPDYANTLKKYLEEKRKIDEKYKKLLQDLRSRQ